VQQITPQWADVRPEPGLGMACTTEPQRHGAPVGERSALTAAKMGIASATAADSARQAAAPRRQRLKRAAATVLLIGHSMTCAAEEPAETDQARIQEVKAAVVMANSLERDYWEDPSAFSGWDAVYGHFRRGYSAEIAERMTEFTLNSDGDLATWVPDEVHVVEVDDSSALAYFDTPTEFGLDGLWGFERYMVVRLRREDRRWVIDWATDSATPPVPHDKP
jgi:hypothetical protein